MIGSPPGEREITPVSDAIARVSGAARQGTATAAGHALAPHVAPGTAAGADRPGVTDLPTSPGRPMGVRATVNDDLLRIVIIDRGRGILPRADSPGLGLGLPLIATLAELLELGTGRNEETEVRMTFRLGASDGAGGP